MTDDLHTLGKAMRDALHAAMDDTPGWYDLARDAIAAFDKALAEFAAKYVIVPREPTEATLRAINTAFSGDFVIEDEDQDMRKVYAAIIAAAKEPGHD